MAMSKRPTEKQDEMWVPTQALARSPGHPFYERLNALLAEAKFDEFVEAACQPFYATKNGRPSVAPGVYMRMLMIGFFEGLDSERGIAWRCADSLALRRFLGYGLSQETPDHSTLCRTRQRLPSEVHQELFAFVLKVLAEKGLLQGKTIGVDATTLEANAALRSIVRRESGESYQDFLVRLAKESGIETPTRTDLARLDRKREGKGSNDDWKHPHDPDAQITRMKDGRTHLAHKAEHAVDMDSGAVLAVTVQPATRGDTHSVLETMKATAENVSRLEQDPIAAEQLSPDALQEWVADKGYHSNDTVSLMEELGLRSYISEPDRGRRRWKDKQEAQRATYANRRRIRSERGKALMRRRGERAERSFAHCLETGGMRRTWLRGHEKILKRYLVHVAAFNLGLVMRSIFGAGTPRGLAEGLAGLDRALDALLDHFLADLALLARTIGVAFGLDLLRPNSGLRIAAAAGRAGFSTGC
jgi:transposase